jgi:hypothetical protein
VAVFVGGKDGCLSEGGGGVGNGVGSLGEDVCDVAGDVGENETRDGVGDDRGSDVKLVLVLGVVIVVVVVALV